jgi:putative ABC transport system permease protein
MRDLWQDVVYSMRTLARRPVFMAVAAISLALGIGLNTAIFTLVNTILWGRLAFPEPDRLVTLSSVPSGQPDQLNGISVPDYMAWKLRAHCFEAIGVVANTSHDFGAEQNGVPAERYRGEDFAPELLQALGVKPFMGRLFTPEEATVDHPAPVIIISYRLWQGRFNGDRDILKRTVLVDGVQTNIVGVMPPDFIFSDDRAEYAAPIRINRFQLRGSARYLTAAARLKPGVSMAQAQAEMDALSVQIAREIPADMDHGRPWMVCLQNIRDGLFGFLNRPLLLLQGAVLLVLLIACANVAALLLARASARHSEVAIRSALGAGRGRIVRQFLTESVVLSIIGGLLGVAFAWCAVQALVAMAPPFFPRLHEITMDSRVLLFSAAISLLTGMVFGAAPAVRGSKANFAESLRESTRGGTAGGSRNRLRGALVVAQLGLALMLLIGSGLLIRSFLKISGADLGCDPSNVLTFAVRIPESQVAKPAMPYHGVVLWDIHPSAQETFRQILDRVKSVPGVQSAAGGAYAPLIGGAPMDFMIEGRATPDTQPPNAIYYPVTPGFFRTMKIAMLRGRDFTMHDTAGSQWVAVINETMAKRYWPDEDPIGKHISIDLSPDDQPREIIAVVRDMPVNPQQVRQDPVMFVPFFQAASRSIGPYRGFRMQLTFLLRTQGDPMRVLSAARRAVAEVAPNYPLANPKTEEEQVALQIQYPRYYSMLLGLFASVATILAAVGIYGVMAFVVEQRTREIGIRMALGAGGWEVLVLMVRQAAWLIVGGLALGLGGALALTRYLSSELWEVQATDPATFAGVTLLLIAVAVLACLVPTRRAVRVDPTVALRYE